MRARLLLLPIILLLLSACGGGASGANGSDPFNSSDDPTPALSISILDSNCESVSEASFSNSEDICVQATLTLDGDVASGETVSFSLASGIGDLSASTALSDSGGVAQVFITNTNLDTGADSVTATYETASASASYEFTAAETLLSLAVLDASCNSVSSPSFTTNQDICVQALLTTDGEPVSAEIISFTLESTPGTLTTSSALTNTNGIAQVIITNEEANAGATSVTATYNSLSESTNYEYLALPPEVSIIPEIQVSMLQNNQPISRFKANEQVQIQALVLDADDIPVADAIVTFSLQGTGPVLSPTTALTNSNGIAQVGMTADDASLGAFAIQADVTLDTFTFSDAMNFEVQASDTVIDESATRFGHFNSDGVFIEGIIGSSAEVDGEVVISAGATVGFNVALVDDNDNRIQTPTPVSFTSNCVSNSQATIDATVTTINGVASATFEDINCAGSTGNSDQIIASVVINNTSFSITRELSILPEDIGSLSFVSATPDEIVLSGTGGQNNTSVSTLLFEVNGELGNPLAQQEVNFSLNTSIGGLTISPSTGLTNSFGQVSTRVTAGTVPTAVRVTAKATGNDGTVIRTQSDLLSVNTGLPDQNSFSISTSNLNPEALSIDGNEVTIRVRLADSFNNPVPDGTTVNFTTEGGAISPTCNTVNGTCAVTWTSTEPRPLDDHRITILATAIGHETLVDSNGNNAYDDTDGGPITEAIKTDSGLDISQVTESGFIDHSEAWRDDNENRERDSFEPFLDYNDDNTFNAPDLLFNGPQCTTGSSCGEGEGTTLHVRRALVMIMSSSFAEIDVLDDSNTVIFSNYQNADNPNLSIARGEALQFSMHYSDSADQPIPSDSTIEISTNNGQIAGNTSFTQGQSHLAGKKSASFTLTNDLESSETATTATVTLRITTPSGAVSSVVFTVSLL